ncbi:unnamed protein product [Trichogramma brassicae]|uniref:Diphthine--ammonia ligase n=1 Tax=Trichogramma brassicae TaxID=86971 RepID=A0A6H5I294_9HYME|nr:unnamed protein product [Trichogramma brassicae]
MKTVALISGGKDSCFNMMQCLAAGHEIVALANLYPIGKDELDSYMFQTVGHQGVEFIGEAIGLPLYREPTTGQSKMQEKNYQPTEEDEVEDLYRLLKKVKDKENIEAVASGAIFSDYQRIRVENVCSRLGLVSLSYLWRRDQEQLLKEMIECSVNAVIIKVASLGLEPRHLGKSISEMQPHLTKMKEKYGLNVCGEGGEYETFTLDCPLYIKSIVVDEYESVVHSNDEIAPVGYLNFKKIHLENKNVGDIISVAGQIPLIPGNMSILESNIKRQCRLTLRHINRIVKAMDSNTELRHIVQGICFLTHPNSIPAARKEWEKRTNNAIVDYVVVTGLPRGAQVEWCVWAHRDNNRFEYEETGKCVGSFKVAIRRRWNYENNVSAIVCYLSTGSSNSTGNLTTETTVSSSDFTLPELIEAFEYLLCKLTKGSQVENPSCNLRIFYKLGSLPGPSFIQQALNHFADRNLVTTIIPTRHLHNFSTFLSVCGIRHE